MRKNCDVNNPPVLSSKKGLKRGSGPDLLRDVERLRAKLEVERSRTQQAHRRFSLELQRQREEAREERERALREITFRLEQQKTLELLRQRDALGRERAAEVRRLLRWRSQSTLRPTRDVHRQLADELAGVCRSAALRPSCKGNGAAYRRLEELLKTLLEQADGQQVALLHRLQQEVDLEKSYFLCHLLEAHSRPALQRKEERKDKEFVVEQSRRRSKSCIQVTGGVREGNLALFRSNSLSQTYKSESPQPMKKKKKQQDSETPAEEEASGGDVESLPEPASSDEESQKCSTSPCSQDNMDEQNGRDYGYLVRQNSELLRALEEMEKSCAALREENRVLRKSSSPETEEKVKRLRKKNAELAIIAKRLEDRARKLQEANLKVASSPMAVRAGAVEQYKRAFARQRARDLAQHADTLLRKDKQISSLCRQLETHTGQHKDPAGVSEFERLLKESQKEVLRLQRQLSVTAAENTAQVTFEAPPTVVDEAPVKGEETPAEGEEPETELKAELGTSSAHQEEQTTEERLQLLESELGKKRKECEVLEHEVRKRQKRCLDLENQLVDERSRNELLVEEADLLRRKAQLLDQSRAENEELKEQLCVLSAQHSSVLEENQRLRAKLENLEQVLKHMREVTERRQQLELEHEQALAILKFKQDEIKRLQRAQLFAKREHENVVQVLEAKVRELEDKCRSQSQQFGMLSQELDKFRLQASKIDLSEAALLCGATLSQLTNGVGLPGDTDVAAVLRTGSTPHAAELTRPERSPVIKHRELPSIGVKSGSTSSPTPPRSEQTHLSPKSAASQPASPRKSSPTHEVDTASEVEELDIDVSPAPYSVSKAAAKLQVFIARYSYNPYDGPNDNPEVELPLTAGEYIYVYGDMDDDGFYEGELMDGRRGLVPSNFVERVSDDDFMSSHTHQAGDASHNSLQESSFHSGSDRLHQHHLRFAHSASDRTDTSTTASASAPKSQIPLTNGLDLDLEEVGVDTVPYPRKLTLIKQLAKSIIIGWECPLVPAGWGLVFSYNVYVDHELRINVPFGTQTKAVLERLDLAKKSYRVAVQCLTEHGNSDQMRCCMLVGRDVCVAPSNLRVERVTATSASLTWLPSNSNYVHIVSLNEEECELVKAGCYSLCLSNLTPSMHYSVKVEARPHRTAWELPPECRERKTALTSFTTLTAGPPDAPLDVQLEQGPSPGIAQISWLPVTIDAAGTSNGVRVTGYTIYADKKKVLEVSSPTAGSALIGPSQIQTLQAARELTVRTMSASGESVDSLPVNVPAKLPAIMSGASLPQCQPVPAAAASVLTASANPDPAVCATSLSAAKTPILPHAATLDEHTAGPVRGVFINTSKTIHHEAPASPASYVDAWANPSSAAPLTVEMPAQEAPPTCASCSDTMVSVSAPMVTPAPMVLPGPDATPTPTPVPVPLATAVPIPTPVSISVPAPMVVPAPATIPVSMSPPIHSPTVTPVSVPVQSNIVTPAVMIPSRETDNPGSLRHVASISDFLEDPCAKLHTPPPPCPKVSIPNDPLDVTSTHLLRPPAPSPFESEPDEDRENTRLVSIEEFLQPVPQPRLKVYAGGHMNPPPDYHGESSRSDLSDILEEEEEDLYSEPSIDVLPRGYSTAQGRSEMWETDSEEEVLEKIIKLPPHAYHNKQLFSIPEVTEEEDNTESEPYARPSRTSSFKNQHCGRPPYHSHKHKTEPEKSVVRYKGTTAVRSRPKVHYSDTVDTYNYLDEEEIDLDSDSSLYAAPSSGNRGLRRTSHKARGDRLRREALLRSQMTSDLTGMVAGTSQGPYLLSKTVHRIKSPTGYSAEIDVEYGTDNDEEPQMFDPGEVVLEQMSSEWWVEGGSNEYHHLPPTSRSQPELPTSSHSWEPGGREAPLTDPGAVWCDATPKSTRSEIRLHREPRACGENEVRIFVALFPYDPAVMSPNPDATEEELPFKEGQIIKVYGDKDADGFYRGEAAGRRGFVPCNMVSEIQVDDEETREQLLMQGFLSTETSMEKIVESAAVWDDTSAIDSSSQDLSRSAAPPAGSRPRRMVAIFDYDPRESSPNADIEAELTFSAGDVIYVFGDMDDDGFYYGDLNGHKGLVPSNFLQAYPETEEETPRTEQAVTESRRDSQKHRRGVHFKQ
ncbi:peripheral-type benzodiazepine receptor-associated protein 1 isoform X3 [Danio rerio]|uniref:Peripheral-type benzodiazepine receptor-associated protein 1 isoform X3 n=1 Tax=Danio rerio TaxID=7955 RepID=A0AC58JN79_DANRE